MTGSNFMSQIKEDLQLIQKDYGNLDENLQRDEFAFNYWILSRLFGIDEVIIPANVTDIHDGGIDCFVHYEDTKELYIIQNKYYDSETPVKIEDASYFLTNPLSVLLDGKYSRCPDLQAIFNKAYNDSEYKIWLHFYVTNNIDNQAIERQFRFFQAPSQVRAFVGVKYHKLNDIELIYYDKRFTAPQRFIATLTTKLKATSLDIRPEDYGIPWMVNLRFMMVNGVDLQNMYKQAVRKNYQLFEENIREYLGASREGSVNNGIVKTLLDANDRENFFYYNNGITIICEKIEETLRGANTLSGASGQSNQYGFRLRNPQIINGCQTINSIYEALQRFPEDKLYNEFEKVFVLVKVYEFDNETKQEKPELDKHIVRYTNSQNSIDDKAFASKRNYFLNLQIEFEKRGVLLLVKQSDKNIYGERYKDKKKSAELKEKGKDLFAFFELNGNSLKNHMIPLEKLLKVLLAFMKNGYEAFDNGNSVLRPNSAIFKNFSLNISQMFTVDNMIALYLLFMKADNDRKHSDDKRIPIPYYVLGFLGNEFRHLEFEQRNDKLKKFFSDQAEFQEIYSFYSTLTLDYAEDYADVHGQDYNRMIRQEIDEDLLKRDTKKAMRHAGPSIKNFLQI